MKIMSVGDVFATGMMDAARKTGMKHPTSVIQGIVVSNRSVAIKLIVAYPCRLASWVFAYRGTRNVELKNVSAMLRLQTRKAVMKYVNPGVFIVDLAETPDATPDATIPPHVTNGAQIFGDAVAVDEHINSLPNVRCAPTGAVEVMLK